MNKIFAFIFFVSTIGTAIAQPKYMVDVLVVGGGTSGIAAGIQSARMGVKTMIVEETPWLGGMITAAGVAAFDGNHQMPSGIWSEFREHLYKSYGGAKNVETGWVSNTLFEPHVGDSIFKMMASKCSALQVLYQYRFVKAIVKSNTVLGGVFEHVVTGKQITVMAKQVIDATELGDVMANAQIPFNVGMEANSLTGENVTVTETNDIIQDLTYVAILKDYGMGVDCTLVKPDNYDPMEFDCCCNEFCSTSSKLYSNVTAQKMLEYGKLPNKKYMINWPSNGNDYYVNLLTMNAAQRAIEIGKAKAKTLRFIYYIQTHLGFKHVGLADDEFPTSDRLPLIPYHREGRRLAGIVRFKVQDIANPFEQKNALYRTGIAVGDYPIDHHHRQNEKAPQHLNFYPVPSFNVPLGALIPPKFKGIIVAEKGISVSNLVNGSTRLQPCVMLTGQAAGVLAALSVKQNKSAVQISVRQVQAVLLDAHAYIMPYFDVPASNIHFAAVQRIGATGILKGKGVPYKWANQTWFNPDSTISNAVFADGFKPFGFVQSNTNNLTIGGAISAVFSSTPKNKLSISQSKWNLNNQQALIEQIKLKWSEWNFTNFNIDRAITRLELAVLLDSTIHPFELWSIDHHGFYKKS